jgi:hypothetical protein
MALAPGSTGTDPQPAGWYIDDVVVQLRIWGSEYAYPFPEPHGPLTLGSALTCSVQLRDDAGLLSREHAVLTPGPAGWEIYDLRSKNGLWIEGVRAPSITLQPGIKIKVGGLILVAESLQLIGLRSLVCRLVGWAPACQIDVDEALQNLRDFAIQRTPLILIGDHDLAPVATRLHRMTLGPKAPFFHYDGGDVAAAVQATLHGTLCVPVRPRAAATAIADAVHDVAIAARPHLVLCASNAGDAAAVSPAPGRRAVIEIPPLSERAGEISRLIHETAADLARDLGAPSTGFTMYDLERLQAIKFSGMADLEDSIRRVIAIRTWGVTAGAKKLGLKHSSLSQWARNKNRKLCT